MSIWSKRFERRSHLWQNAANPSSDFEAVVLVCLFLVLSYLAAALGGAMSLPRTLSPLWPGCALLVAVLLLTRRKFWPALMAAGFAGFFLYDLQVGLTVRTVLLLLLADTIEVLVAALGVSYSLGSTLYLNSVKRVTMYLLFAGILAPVSGALVGALALGFDYWNMWRLSFFSEALALLTLTPAILGWVNTARTRPPKSAAYYVEEVVLLAGLGGLGYFTFVAGGGASRPVLLYSLVPFLVWSALRFGSMGVATSTLALAFLAIGGTVHGRGPFSGPSPLNNTLSLQLFLLVATIPFMILAALVEERKEAVQALRDSELRERRQSKQLQTILDAVPVAVLIAGDPMCQRITANRAGRELLRLAPGENASKSAPADEQPKFRIMAGELEVPAGSLPIQRAAATASQIFDVSESIVFADGTERDLLANAAPLLDEDGRPYGAVAALLDITERKRAEKELRESDERFRLAAQAGKMFAYEWNIASDVIVRSAESGQIFGPDEAGDTTGQKVLAKVHPDDLERLKTAVAALHPEQPYLRISFRMVRADGTVIWVERNSLAHFDEQGRMVRMIGMMTDITERKRAEEELKETESRFRLVADTAPALMWMSGPDKLCTYFNKPWLVFTGRSMDQELGNGWAEGVHREDLQRCMDTYTQAFDRREEFRMEYRLRRHDGEYRWVLDIGVPRFSQDRSFIGYIGIGIDVTDRKLADEALAGMGRRLMEAHEEERSRIARELHDDINQRIALLAIKLVELKHNLPDSVLEVSAGIDGASKHLTEIGNDIQTLSHRLHSSKLEYLGIAAAARSFCKEISEQQKVEIDFRHDGIPRKVPKELSLCLFRVLQEALQNAVKHSGVRHFRVELQGISGEIRMTVSDTGTGFDPHDAMNRHGLGLISMRERMEMVGGEFFLESQPGRGTTIKARIPFSSDVDLAREAG